VHSRSAEVGGHKQSDEITCDKEALTQLRLITRRGGNTRAIQRAGAEKRRHGSDPAESYQGA
jgi:hypothetical protein